MASLLLLNGPNMGRLGTREPETYGSTTLAEIEAGLAATTREAGHAFDSFQSDAEHELLNRIHEAGDEGVDLILFNPAAFTHTSVALRDALIASRVPFIEIHMSNPSAREPFRRHSYFSDIAVGVVAGFGASSYRLALDAALERLTD